MISCPSTEDPVCYLPAFYLLFSFPTHQDTDSFCQLCSLALAWEVSEHCFTLHKQCTHLLLDIGGKPDEAAS